MAMTDDTHYTPTIAPSNRRFLAQRNALAKNPAWAGIDDTDRDVVALGETVLIVISQRRTFDEWLEIGEAQEILQHHAMRRSNSTSANGKRYAEAYNRLAPAHLRTMDKSERRKALLLWTRREQIRPWYREQAEGERRRMQHPQTILNNFAAYLRRERRQAGERPAEPGDGRRQTDAVRRRAGQAAAIDAATERLHQEIDAKVTPTPFRDTLDISDPEVAAETFKSVYADLSLDTINRFAVALLIGDDATVAPAGDDADDSRTAPNRPRPVTINWWANPAPVATQIITDGRRAKRTDQFIAEVAVQMASMLGVRTTLPRPSGEPGAAQRASRIKRPTG